MDRGFTLGWDSVSVPTTEAEVVAQLTSLKRRMETLSANCAAIQKSDTYSKDAQELMNVLGELGDGVAAELQDTITGLATVLAARNPSSMGSIISELTKR